MAKETPTRDIYRKERALFCGLCLFVLFWTLFLACSDPAKQPKTLKVELLYSQTFALSGFPTVRVVSADGRDVTQPQEPNTNPNSGTQNGQFVQVDCSGQPTRSQTPTHFLHAKMSTENRQTLEGKVALSQEICDKELAKIVMMIPERVGQLIATKTNAGDQVGLIEVAGVFGHASAMFGDGRVLVMGGVSQYSPSQGVLPSLWRLGENPFYKGSENSEAWLYDPEAATLRRGKGVGEQGLLGRAFHSLTAQGNKAWAVGGWLPLGPLPSQGWLPTISFTLPVVSAQEFYASSEASLLVEKLDASFRSVGHLAFAVKTDATNSPTLALVGGRQAHPNDDPTLPPTPVPPIRRDNACRDDEERVFLSMHAASLLPSGQDLVVTGGLWTRTDGSPLPPRFSNVIWRVPLAQLQGQAAFCAKISPSQPEEGIRVVFANPKDGEPKSLSVPLGGLPDEVGWVGHSMTLVGKEILVYGGISLPPVAWPWRDGEAISDADIYQKGFVSVRERAFWLSEKDNGERLWSPVLLQEGEVGGEKGCGALGLAARAMHQATRLLDGRILLSGGLRCLPRSPEAPLQQGCVGSVSLHPHPVLLYTPKDEAMALSERPRSLIYRCVGGGGSQNNPSEPPIQRLFHTATRLPSGQVLLWGGLTNNGTGLLLKQSMPVEVFSPSLGDVSVPNPLENNLDGGIPEGIGPDVGTPESTEPTGPENLEPPNPEQRPEDAQPDARPPAQTLMRDFKVIGKIKNVRTLIGDNQEINLFFALQGSIQRLDRSPLYSADGGAKWSLVRMRIHADFQNGEWVEYDNAIVIPEITETAQWDVVLHPSSARDAFVAIRCSDALSKELFVDPKEPAKVSLCRDSVAKVVPGIAVLHLNTITLPNNGPTYAYAPLSAWLVAGDISLRRLRIRGGPNVELALLGAADGMVTLQGGNLRWGHTLPQRSEFSIVLRFDTGTKNVDSLSMVFFRMMLSGGAGEIIDYAWLEDTSDTRCLLASVKGTGVLEGVRSDSPSPPVGIGDFENLSKEGVWVSCYAGALDGTLARKIVLHDANVSKRPKRLLVLQKGTETRLYFSFDDVGTPTKPRVFVLSPADMQILDTWSMEGGAQSEMVSVSDPKGNSPLYLAQFSLGLPWNSGFLQPSVSLYAPELSFTAQGYAFPMIRPSPIPQDYWTDSFVNRSSLASKSEMVAMAGILNATESLDVSSSGTPFVEIQGHSVLLWARRTFHDGIAPPCDPNKPTLAASCSCAQTCTSGCCGPLGMCRSTGQSSAVDPLPFYCGVPGQTCGVCDKRRADACDGSWQCVCGSVSACGATQVCGKSGCGDCKPEEVEIQIDGSSVSPIAVFADAGSELTVSVSAYPHRLPDLPMMPPGTKQALVVGISREGYGTEAWGCAYLKEVSDMECSATKTLFPQLDRGSRFAKIYAPLWISNVGGNYRVIAKTMVGMFTKCDEAMQAFEASDWLTTRPMGTLQVKKPTCTMQSGFSLEKVVIDFQGKQPDPPIVSIRKGDSIAISFRPFFYANRSGDTAIHYALFDRLGNLLLGTPRCYSVLQSPNDYCTTAKQMQAATVSLPSGSSAAPGDYFFRVDLKPSQTCSVTLPPTDYKRNATIGVIRLSP